MAQDEMLGRDLDADKRESTATSMTADANVEAAQNASNTTTIEKDDHALSTKTRNSMADDIEANAGQQTALDEKVGDTAAAEAHDPNIVDWDGPDDPQNPLNWSAKLRYTNVAIISTVTVLTPLASSIFAPGISSVLETFHSTDTTIGSFMVSVFLLGYCFGPLVIAPLSEMYGRLPLYHACNILFCIFSIACALSQSVGQLIAFRFLAGTAGSSPLTLGGGSIADMIPKERRGSMMAIWTLGPLLGPVIGPVAGGFLSDGPGWRWTFWVLAMASGAVTVLSIIFMRESFPPVLLQRKTDRLIKETGNTNLRSKLADPRTPKQLFLHSIIRPTKMLFLSPIVSSLSIYMAIIYGYLYLIFTTISSLYEGVYGWSEGVVGLSYLGIGLGSLLGLFIFGSLSDKLVNKAKAKGNLSPEVRLLPMCAGAASIPIGLFWYGWSAEAQVHWIMPIIGTFFVGFGLISIFMPITTYLVDCFTLHAASALAANTVLRSLVGAVLPLAGPKMYAALGFGWEYSLLGFIALALAPMSIVFLKFGHRIRESTAGKIQF